MTYSDTNNNSCSEVGTYDTSHKRLYSLLTYLGILEIATKLKTYSFILRIQSHLTRLLKLSGKEKIYYNKLLLPYPNAISALLLLPLSKSHFTL